ncbi:MAG: hypothetical protein H6638_05705 [Ardenticatenales bacterium]|nr:hypothetical protein [Ardenticatenales bacterium]
MKALLWAGIEGYCPLWQALWEVNAVLPDVSEQDRWEATRQLVQSLVARGAIQLLWYMPLDGEKSARVVERADAQPLISQAESWVVRPWEQETVGYVTTDKGEALYRSLFDTAP